MELLDNNNRPVRVVKLRNPWKAVDYIMEEDLFLMPHFGEVFQTHRLKAHFSQKTTTVIMVSFT